MADVESAGPVPPPSAGPVPPPSAGPVPPPFTGAVPPPGAWPGDPAGPGTPVAHRAADVAELAAAAPTLDELVARQSVCRACPRLVAWREQVAVVRRRAFRDEPYWGRPIPGWGSARPRLLIVGLAPAAHGGNRTGRIFTGDRSGDFLFASLYRCGLAEKPTSVSAGDGQRLLGARMAAAVRCAPPDNKPEPAERDACAPWLVAELRLILEELRVIVCLGSFAWQAIWPTMAQCGFVPPRPRPLFGHGAEVRLPTPEAPPTGSGARPAVSGAGPSGSGAGPSGSGAGPSVSGAGPSGSGAGPTGSGVRPTGSGARSAGGGDSSTAGGGDSSAAGGGDSSTAGGVLVIGCYHPSQQNTFTGRVTPAMLDAIFVRARDQADLVT